MNNTDNNSENKRKYLLSEKTVKWIARIVFGSVFLVFAGGIIYIYSLKKSGRENSIVNQEVHDIVLEIHQEKSDVPWYRGRMGNGDWLTLNRPMVYSVAIGDSIIKEKGQTFFTLKKKGTNEISKWEF